MVVGKHFVAPTRTSMSPDSSAGDEDLHSALRVARFRRRMACHPLPASHVTSAKHFEEIVTNEALLPRRCRFFGDARLYLYYGGVYYRSTPRGCRNRDELPVAFLFDPQVLTSVTCYYPFDTGALASARFGSKWKRRLSPVERFSVPTDWGVDTGGHLIGCVYGSNAQYLSGTPDVRCQSKPEPIPLLYKFLTDDLSHLNVDHRQTCIECHVHSPLPWGTPGRLLWIGYPVDSTRIFNDLCRRIYPTIPEVWAYHYRTPFDPSQLEAMLEERAARYIERYSARDT